MMDIIKTIALIAFVLGLLVYGCIKLDSIGCYGRWEDSGYKVKYGFTSGCVVYQDNRWIPERNIRSIDD